MIYKTYMKRGFDFVFSFLFLTIVSPLIFISALGIKVNSKGPVLFTQERVGLNGIQFKLYKLRTMSQRNNREASQTFSSDPDVFWVGKILRRLKIDELPQMLNVLLGDMSLVGPRPCLEVTKNEMPTWALQRFHLRPGMTGLAQINGNISLSWDERWSYDIKYIEQCTFLNDLKIFVKTALVVILGEERFRRVP